MYIYIYVHKYITHRFIIHIQIVFQQNKELLWLQHHMICGVSFEDLGSLCSCLSFLKPEDTFVVSFCGQLETPLLGVGSRLHNTPCLVNGQRLY